MMKEVYLNSTAVYCSACQEVETAGIIATDHGVYLEKMCPKGSDKVKLAADYQWYLARTAAPRRYIERWQDNSFNPAAKGCPLDCGPCSRHIGPLVLPVFSITNDCNLNCPICFTYNRPDQKYYKSVAETKQIIGHILAKAGCVDLINLTGGEPTLHPELFDILAACKQPGISRITMNTNGLKLAADKHFAAKIKASGVQLVLSLDTFDKEKSLLIHGKDITDTKKQALKVIEELDIPVTILCVCIKNVNEEDVAAIVSKYLIKPFVRSITIQNMAYTGLNGRSFKPHQHITIDEVENLLTTQAPITKDDFFTPVDCHPLCYSAAYYIVWDDKVVPLTRLMDRETLAAASRGSYIIKPDKEFIDKFHLGLDTLWAQDEAETLVEVLHKVILEIYPPGLNITPEECQKRADRLIKPLLIHSHMDADNFDIDRISHCGDLVPDESGRMIPACSYNLLYRQQDPRFWLEKRDCREP
jgi:uncharacterized radical SAM superfamily Fe-S cluster-containing enzyme